jgi:hypothetical protein
MTPRSVGALDDVTVAVVEVPNASMGATEASAIVVE